MTGETRKNIENTDDKDAGNSRWTTDEYINHLKEKAANHHAYKIYSQSTRITCIGEDKLLYLSNGDNWNDKVDREDFCPKEGLMRYARCFSYSISESVAMWMLYGGMEENGLMIDIKPSLIKGIVNKCTEVDVGYWCKNEDNEWAFHTECTIYKPNFSIYLIDILYYGKKNPEDDTYDLKRSDTKYQRGDPKVINHLRGYKKSYPWSYENECRMILEFDKNDENIQKLLRNQQLKMTDVRINFKEIFDSFKATEKESLYTIVESPNYKGNHKFKESALHGKMEWNLCKGCKQKENRETTKEKKPNV